MVRLAFHRPAIVSHRLLDFPVRLQGQSEVVVGFGVVGPGFQSLPIVCDRLGEPALAGQGQGKVVVRRPGRGRCAGTAWQCAIASSHRPWASKLAIRLLWASTSSGLLSTTSRYWCDRLHPTGPDGLKANAKLPWASTEWGLSWARPIMRYGLVDPPLTDQGQRQVVVDLAKAGIEFQRRSILLDGLVDPAPLDQRDAKIVVGFDVAGVEFRAVDTVGWPRRPCPGWSRPRRPSNCGRNCSAKYKRGCGSRGSRCRAKKTYNATPGHQDRHQQRRRDAGHPATIRPGPAHVCRSPRQGHVQANLRQVGVAIGHGLPDLHQPDHRHQHPHVPQPAHEKVRTPPPTASAPAEMHSSRTIATITLLTGRSLPGCT